MTNTFELIDLESGNVIADFRSEEDALASLGRQYTSHGPKAIRRLSLMLVTDDDQILVAMRDELEQLVRRSLHPSAA